MTREAFVAKYGLFDCVDELLFADGYDDCIIGVLYDGPSCTPRVAYSKAAIIEKLTAEMQGPEPHVEAEEFFSFNIQGAYVGPHTPAYVELTDD